MLHLERLILELSPVYRCAEVWVLIGNDLAHLNEHAFDDTVNICVQIREQLTVGARMACAKAKEICNGAGCDIIEKFKLNHLGFAIEIQLELRILPSLGRIDHLLESVRSESFVDDIH